MKFRLTTTVKGIKYYNEESHWGVLVLNNPLFGKGNHTFPEAELIATGNFRDLYEGARVTVEGKDKFHTNYGIQLEISSIQLERGADRASIVNFLAKSSIKGIEIALANRIYERFGSDSIDVVLNQTNRILEVKGIGPDTYNKVIESVARYKRMQALIEFCTKLGIPYTIIDRLDWIYGEKALSIIKTNVYQILDDAHGILTFKQVDEIGTKLNIPKDDPVRLKACLKYCLINRVMMNSSTGCSSNELCNDFMKHSGMTQPQLYQKALATLNKEGLIIPEGSFIYYRRYYEYEEKIACILSALRKTPVLKKTPKHEVISVSEDLFSFYLNSQQKSALSNIVNDRIAILTGGPGTGKSTLTKAIVHLYKRKGIPFKLLSPTGKATRRLAECTGSQAQTIHKFLGVNRSLEDLEVQPCINEGTVFIIDEASMLDIIMLVKLLELALSNTIRLVLIGDPDQLPSVQAGNVLGDLMNSGLIPTYKLTDIMRQAEDSHIIKYCYQINIGEYLKPCEHKDFVYKTYCDADDLYDDLYKYYIEEVNKHGLLQTQIIAPYKRGVLGVETLNKRISNSYNKHDFVESFKFRVGDKVMQLINDYDKSIFNGEVGIVTDIPARSIARIEFQSSSTQHEYSPSAAQDVQLAYACTCHKSQGAEYDVVFVILDNEIGDFLLNRKMLYTAVSRGKKKVYILSMNTCVTTCIKNTSEKPRITKLNTLTKKYCS